MSDQPQPLFELYDQLIGAWNQRSAQDFCALFQGKGELVGFDGTRVAGKGEISDHLKMLFKAHKTPAYTGAVERLHSLKSGVIMISAKAGMKMEGSGDFHPDLWTEQSVVAVKTKDGWKISLFQNTPAGLSDDRDRQQDFVRDFKVALAEKNAHRRPAKVRDR